MPAKIVLQLTPAEAERLKELWAAHAASIHAMLLKWCASPDDAADLLQEVFRVLATSPHLMDRAEHPRAFLCVTARRLAIDHARKSGAREAREAAYHSEGEASAPDLLTDPALQAAITRAFESLPADQRRVARAKLIEGKSLQEIASAEGTSLNTIASRLRYSLDKLREQLRPYFDDMKKPASTTSDEVLIRPLAPKRVPSLAPGLEGLAALASDDCQVEDVQTFEEAPVEDAPADLSGEDTGDVVLMTMEIEPDDSTAALSEDEAFTLFATLDVEEETPELAVCDFGINFEIELVSEQETSDVMLFTTDEKLDSIEEVVGDASGEEDTLFFTTVDSEDSSDDSAVTLEEESPIALESEPPADELPGEVLIAENDLSMQTTGHVIQPFYRADSAVISDAGSDITTLEASAPAEISSQANTVESIAQADLPNEPVSPENAIDVAVENDDFGIIQTLPLHAAPAHSDLSVAFAEGFDLVEADLVSVPTPSANEAEIAMLSMETDPSGHESTPDFVPLAHAGAETAHGIPQAHTDGHTDLVPSGALADAPAATPGHHAALAGAALAVGAVVQQPARSKKQS